MAFYRGFLRLFFWLLAAAIIFSVLLLRFGKYGIDGRKTLQEWRMAVVPPRVPVHQQSLKPATALPT